MLRSVAFATRCSHYSSVVLHAEYLPVGCKKEVAVHRKRQSLLCLRQCTLCSSGRPGNRDPLECFRLLRARTISLATMPGPGCVFDLIVGPA